MNGKQPFSVTVPADVPRQARQNYIDNYTAITRATGNLMLFVCDHKLEHLNRDFYGKDIHPDAMHPGHLFSIASQGTIGAFATHLGLIARYGMQYPTVNYIAKLNGKTDLIPTDYRDPQSLLLYDVDDVVTLHKNSGLSLRGVGYTIYLGSAYESEMLAQAAQVVFKAHQHGLVAVLWIYPRGTCVTDDNSPEMCAGASGVAAALGSDFVKIKPPQHAESLRIATIAAGNTKVICSGGSAQPFEQFLQELYAQLHVGGAAGNATGRTIFQYSQQEAIARTHAIAALVFEDATVAAALERYRQSCEPNKGQ